MKNRKLSKIAFIISSIFIICIFGGAFLNAKNIKQQIYIVFSSKNVGTLSTNTTEAENKIKENFCKRSELVDLYGVWLNAIHLNIVNNFKFLRDDNGIMQLKERNIDDKKFEKSVIELSQSSMCKSIPILYVQLPDRVEKFPAKNAFNYFGKTQTDFLRGIKDQKIDILNVPDNLSAQPENFFFRGDVHLKSEAEFEIAREVVNRLETKYGLRFDSAKTVFNEENYKWTTKDFFGNLVRSSGHFYTQKDLFKIFSPLYDTNLNMYEFSTGLSVSGSFNDVLTNNYPLDTKDDYYWVTYYGRFPQPCYEYTNNNISDGPNLLIIEDSIFMRAHTLLSLCAKKVTVMDPRAFKNMDYIAQALHNENYDAIIICGSCADFYSSGFSTELPSYLREILHDTSSNCSMKIISLNDDNQGNHNTIKVDKSKSSIKIDGWAVNEKDSTALASMYAIVGNYILQCQYGSDNEEAVTDTGNLISHAGFSLNIPTTYLQDRQVDRIQFCGYAADHSYLSVSYPIEYK